MFMLCVYFAGNIFHINLLIYCLIFQRLKTGVSQASLPHVLGDKETQRNKSEELFWEIVDVSLFSCIFSVLLRVLLLHVFLSCD